MVVLNRYQLSSVIYNSGSADEERARAYDIRRIVNFLNRIKMEQYTEVFTSNGINGELLIALNDDDLEDQGINSYFHRFKIIFCFKREVSGRDIRCPPAMLARLLEGDANLKKYIPSILKNEVDGEMLLQCDNEKVLAELEINPKFHYKKIVTLIKSCMANKQ